MTLGTIANTTNAAQLMQDASAPVKDQSQEQAAPQAPQDTTQVSGQKRPPKQSKTFEKFKGWIKNKMENADKPLTTSQKLGRVAISAATGAAAGAIMIATGAAPAIAAVAGAAVGAVAMGAFGGFIGFLGGMIAEKSGRQGAMGTGTMIGVVGGGAVGAGIGGLAGYAEGSLLIKAAELCGGGPLGGAIAYGLFSGAMSALSMLKRSAKEEEQQAQQPQPAQPQQPAPVQQPDPAQTKEAEAA